MASLGTIGNVLNATFTTSARLLPTYAFAYGSVWDDVRAAEAIKTETGFDPIVGDTVRIAEYQFSNIGNFDETKVFDGVAWVAMSSQTFSFPRSAITTSRKGYKDWSDIAAVAAIRDAGKDFPIDGDAVTLYDDTWTSTRYYKDGKWVEDSLYFPGVPSAPSQPGIDDELKPNLPKRLRDW